MSKPRVFIGSSTEGIELAEAILSYLAKDTEPILWDQVVRPGRFLLEELKKELHLNDFAIFIASPDDIVETRGIKYPIMRDNVLLELGLFSGVLGIKRTFLVCPDKPKIKLPSDLDGIIYVTYDSEWTNRDSRSKIAAMRIPGQMIKTAIKELWPDIEASIYKDFEKPLRSNLLELFNLLLDYKQYESILDIGLRFSKTLWKEGFHTLLVELGKTIQEAAIRLNKPEIQAKVLVDLGWITACSGEKNEAIKILNKAIELAKDIKSFFWEAKSIRHLAGIAFSTSDYEEAKNKLEMARIITEKIEDKAEKIDMLAGIYYGLSEINLELSNLTEAEKNIREAENLYSSLEMDRGIKIFTQKGKLEEKRGKLDGAKKFYERGLDLAILHKRRDDEIRNLFGLYRVYSKQGDKKKAIEKQELAISLQETVPMLFV